MILQTIGDLIGGIVQIGGQIQGVFGVKVTFGHLDGVHQPCAAGEKIADAVEQNTVARRLCGLVCDGVGGGGCADVTLQTVLRVGGRGCGDTGEGRGGLCGDAVAADGILAVLAYGRQNQKGGGHRHGCRAGGGSPSHNGLGRGFGGCGGLFGIGQHVAVIYTADGV